MPSIAIVDRNLKLRLCLSHIFCGSYLVEEVIKYWKVKRQLVKKHSTFLWTSIVWRMWLPIIFWTWIASVDLRLRGSWWLRRRKLQRRNSYWINTFWCRSMKLEMLFRYIAIIEIHCNFLKNSNVNLHKP